MFRDEINAVCNTANGKLNLLAKNPAGYVLMSILAGMYIGLGSVLMLVVGGVFTAGGAYSTKLINGLVFSVGLCFVTMGGAELFTGNNFVMAVAGFKKAAAWGNIVKLWVICWIGNLVGSVITGGLFSMAGIASGDIGAFCGSTAASKMAGAPMNLFAKAILCNICVCLAIWCGAKLKTEGAKIVMNIACVVTFVTCGFEHSIANMTFFTVGLLCPNGAAVSVGAAAYNLLIVTLGNIVGGVLFVAVPYCLIAKENK